jgi:penicillin-binding protein A
MRNKNQLSKTLMLLCASAVVIVTATAMSWTKITDDLIAPAEKISELLSEKISANLVKNDFSNDIVVGPNNEQEKFTVSYTLDEDLQIEAQTLLKRYKPDYAAIFMYDVKTGEVLAMSSWQKSDPKAENWNLRASFPAASIFKIVTASAAVDHAGFEPDRKIAFNGSNYTLYKRNVLSEQINKWTRFVTLKDAFARSLNTAFGRLTLENLDSKSLAEYSERFQFNKKIETDFEFEPSTAVIPDDNAYKLTQAASGFTRDNTMSPVHGAMLASTIVNKGSMVTPFIVKEITDQNGLVIYKPGIIQPIQVMKPESADKIEQMMEQTVLSGTSRKAFRKILKERKFKEIEMGGKTGHLTGTNPKGRTDWFVGYASDNENNTVALAAITVNIKTWTVKSSSLAEMMFRKHFKNILENKKKSVVSR